MIKKSKLSREERELFAAVYRAAFANPFGDSRRKLEQKIVGVIPKASGDDSITLCMNEVKRHTVRLEAEGRANINSFSGKDRQLIQIVFLFDVFYRFRNLFDTFIQDQIKAGDVSLEVPFSGEVFELMEKRGFDAEYSNHYFALAYQLRRAFFFIGSNLVGSSPAMKNLRLNLWHNVFTHSMDIYERYLWNRMEDFSTLILGETGTGKGAAARAIGSSGFIPYDKKKNRFVESFTHSFQSLNLSQFPEALMESELFGHKKGAFTGAIEDYKGVFARCSPYGAILLDEIGEISIPVQIKLLQVLQEREFTPVGSHMRGRFHGRVIAATNRPLDDIRSQGFFRDDFYYRLCSDIITVPPLRLRIKEEPKEMDELLAFTVNRMLGRESPEIVRFVRKVIDKTPGPEYSWPGNVRELEQCVRRILLRKNYEGDVKKTADDPQSKLFAGLEKGDIDAHSLLSGYCRLLHDRFGTYEEVARRTKLDRRTVKKYIDNNIQ